MMTPALSHTSSHPMIPSSETQALTPEERSQREIDTFTQLAFALEKEKKLEDTLRGVQTVASVSEVYFRQEHIETQVSGIMTSLKSDKRDLRRNAAHLADIQEERDQDKEKIDEIDEENLRLREATAKSSQESTASRQQMEHEIQSLTAENANNRSTLMNRTLIQNVKDIFNDPKFRFYAQVIGGLFATVFTWPVLLATNILNFEIAISLRNKGLTEKFIAQIKEMQLSDTIIIEDNCCCNYNRALCYDNLSLRMKKIFEDKIYVFHYDKERKSQFETVGWFPVVRLIDKENWHSFFERVHGHSLWNGCKAAMLLSFSEKNNAIPSGRSLNI